MKIDWHICLFMCGAANLASVFCGHDGDTHYGLTGVSIIFAIGAAALWVKPA
jgi:hypothetical protein